MSKQHQAPKWILRLLDWWVQRQYLEEIHGDLYELYEEQLQAGHPGKAKRVFIWNAIRFCRFSNFNKRHLNLYPMLWKNYTKVAWRQLLRDKLYATINISGLAIGIACFLIVLFYIQTERSYDQHHPDKDRLYRVSQNFVGENGEPLKLAYSYSPLSQTLEDQISIVEKTSRIFTLSGGYGESGGQFTNLETQIRYIENNLYFADSTFFDLFNYTFIQGAKLALDDPFSIVLKASIAKKYFQNDNAIGKVLEFRDEEGTYRFTVKGVVDDPIGPSHFDFDLLASFSSLRTMMPWIDNWYHPPVFHYALLNEEATLEDFQAQLTALPPKVLKKRLADEVSFEAQAVTDIHLYSHRESELQANGQASRLTLFGIIGLLILLIACINYMNLATARASSRIKEVNIRRVFGARRGQLVQQFLGESLLFTTLGFVLAILLVKISLPFLNDLFITPIQATFFNSWQMPLLLVSLLLLIALVAGFYPSIFLSAIKLGKYLQGSLKSSVTTALSVRKSLVIFQFAVSCALIVMAILVHRQVNYLQNKHLGFDQDQVLAIPLRDQENQENYESLKSEFLQMSQVLSVSGSSGFPGGRGFSEFFILPKQGAFDSLQVRTLTVDHDFAETYGLNIKDGRDFSNAFPSDATNNFLINESLAKRLNWKNPVGEELMLRHYYRGEKQKTGRVVGVIEDFHYESLKETVQPMLFHILPGSYFYNYISVKLTGPDLKATMGQLESKWQAFNPDRTFEYRFLDETFNQLYLQEQKFNGLFQLFTILAVIIACMGLFALAAFTIERRRKEVAVRKVLGASTSGIMLQLSGQFVRLALIALLVAIPLAWYFSHQWLENYPYRINIGWWSFTLAGVLIVALALFTSSYHAFRAANLNPAQVLKNEE